jgi:hypothetical protein
MPTRKKQNPTRVQARVQAQAQQIEKPVVIILCLPLVCLGLFLGVVLLFNKPASGKPAPVAAAPTASPVAVSTAVRPTLAASPTPAFPASTTAAPAASAGTTPPASSPNPATTAAPSTAATASRTVKPSTPEGKGIRLTKTESGIKFDLLVSPGHIGNNNYFVLLSENGNQAVTEVSLVRLSVTSLDMDMGVATLDLQPAGADQPGLYSGIDNKLQMLSMVGKFNLAVLVQRPGQSDVTTSFQLDVTGS